ncbi:hypothetical protein AB0D91_42235 [Streptomyces canus]|uniref:hypothetical protein n=1 Tax=Streptomyces canus TaxID=58343 RepID=UPI0033EAB5F3
MIAPTARSRGWPQVAPAPRLVVYGEPVSALHLTTQARVLDLLVDIQRRTGVAYLLIRTTSRSSGTSATALASSTGRHRRERTGGRGHDGPEQPYPHRLLLAAPVAALAEQRRRREARQRL